MLITNKQTIYACAIQIKYMTVAWGNVYKPKHRRVLLLGVMVHMNVTQHYDSYILKYGRKVRYTLLLKCRARQRRARCKQSIHSCSASCTELPTADNKTVALQTFLAWAVANGTNCLFLL